MYKEAYVRSIGSSSSTKIKSIRARVCYNSRGEESVEVDVYVNGFMGRAIAPSGASVGKYEAVAFAPGGAKATVELIDKYSPQLIGLDASDYNTLTKILREIDGTENYSRIGGSAAYAITIASVDAASKSLGIPLFQLLKPEGDWKIPYPLGNVIGGGKHAGKGAPDMQEFLVVPIGAPDIRQALAANFAVHREVGVQLERKVTSFTRGRGDEGAWAPFMDDEEALEVVYSSAKSVSEKFGFSIRVGLDVASSSLWDEEENLYVYRRSGVKRSPEEQLEYIISLIERYELIYVEDPLHENSFNEFAELTKKVKGVFVVGDDLLATNVKRLIKASEVGACNGAILKVNQAGALGDAMNFAHTANRLGYNLITSHRSGDTSDCHIAHIAVATGSKMIKTGIMGGERVAKLNELLRISEFLKECKMVDLGGR
ncbi:MAG: enolase [Nitrososphaerales archaeon]|nr:enolase [Nitrososphaerales archaeon]